MNMEIKEILKNNYNVKTDINELKENTEIYSDCNMLFENDTDVVAMKAIQTDFGPEELADVVNIAESLYKAIGKHVYICLAMPFFRRVTVKEMSIPSEADFTIKLAVIDMFSLAMQQIRHNIAIGTADDSDRQMLMMLPMMVQESQRQKVREECFRLLRAF